MMDQVLFQMPSFYRAKLIGRHDFYVEQAKKRLLTQFREADIRAEADLAGEQFLEEHQRFFNPDSHHVSDFYERADLARGERYQLLSDMRDSVRLSVVAGLFHEWEKNLRQWLVDEVRHWCGRGEIKSAIWKQKLIDLFDLFEGFGWPLKNAPYFKELDACRLVVNVYKHGGGNSLNELDKCYPKYLEHPLDDMHGRLGHMWFTPSYKYLKIKDDDLEAFSDAIIQFWKDVPENVPNTQITNPPSWLVKAITKDQNNQKQAT